jgi:hypothetical protein
MPTLFCPDCKEALSLGPNTKAGKRLTCPHCGTDLDVINTSPLELDFAYDEPDFPWDREDWDSESHWEAVGHDGEARPEKSELLE